MLTFWRPHSSKRKPEKTLYHVCPASSCCLHKVPVPLHTACPLTNSRLERNCTRCILIVYWSITVVSSRESKILAVNRTIAEPYELTMGAEPGGERKWDFVDNAHGLFSAQAAPKPPPALYSITEGMRVGGSGPC